jgi:RNA polymerase sigma-70 factor (ECF subfamily)
VSIPEAVETLYQAESRRILAALIRLLGDFDLAEEALQEAFSAALKQWPRSGVPANPRAWLVSAGRFKVIDGLRKRNRLDTALPELAADAPDHDPALVDDEAIHDDRLRLIFICCHPALPIEARVALTLREVCGLSTEAIAHAFLTSPATLAQRIVRAKAKIREARLPYEVPDPEARAERLDAVLHVIYLVFNEGYYASSGEALTRSDLSAEAIRLGRLLVSLLPEAEALGLLALMLLHESRRAARVSPDGDLVVLEAQDRRKWDQALIVEGLAWVRGALTAERVGPYTLQAAIAGVHAVAPGLAETDWARIVSFYDQLLRLTPSAVVAFNRAGAIAMRDGPAAGLALMEAILERGDLRDYHLAHAARADLLRRLGRVDEARLAYSRALDLAVQAPERRYLLKRLDELSA